jgi:protease I
MILMPIPDFDFDPSETGIPWSILTENNIPITFATPSGKAGAADKRMLTGGGLGIWRKILPARKDAIEKYELMIKSNEFRNPIKYDSIDPACFDGIILPGGHASGMKQYLESKILQNIIVFFFNSNKPVGAICHGVVLVSGSKDPHTGKSVIFNYKTTALLKKQELSAYYLTFLWLGKYYRTYSITVEDEVKSSLSETKNFLKGNLGLLRDSNLNLTNGFTVLDKNYLSARWPGDAYKFSYDYIQLLKKFNI